MEVGEVDHEPARSLSELDLHAGLQPGGKELLEFEHPRITRLPYRLAGRFRVLDRAIVLSALAPLI